MKQPSNNIFFLKILYFLTNNFFFGGGSEEDYMSTKVLLFWLTSRNLLHWPDFEIHISKNLVHKHLWHVDINK